MCLAKAKNACLCLLAVCVLGGCVTIEKKGGFGSPEPKQTVLRVGITPNMPPIAFKSWGAIKGLEADFAQALADDLGLKLRFVALDWDDQIPALEEDRIDIIMSGMSVTQLRSMRVAFAEPYMRAGQLLLVRATDRDLVRMPRLITAGEKSIGVERRTTGEMFVHRYCPRARRVGFDSAAAAVDALVAGELDAVVHDAPVIWHLAARRESDNLAAGRAPLTAEDLAWAVNRRDRELLQSVNRVLAAWKRDRRLHGFLDAWIPFYEAYLPRR